MLQRHAYCTTLTAQFTIPNKYIQASARPRPARVRVRDADACVLVRITKQPGERVACRRQVFAGGLDQRYL
ncbi:MAG: hypothetical protein LBD44_02920 [Spirochaetaceae bacterium]|nr:hypothetical protein [Spirochaetaceae bacterium]